MKKHLLLISLVCIAFAAYSQNAVPNGNFESWNEVTYNYPQNYPFNSNYDVLYRYKSIMDFNVVKTTDAYHGSNAVQLSTLGSGSETSMAYFINVNPNNGNPATWSGGMAYSQKTTGISGYYKYNVAGSDSALIFVVFSKAGHNIGTYVSTIGGVHNDYVPFNITFSPALAETPDSVIFAATSSNIMLDENGVAGSVLFLDYISFTGVASQPAMLNGDFETWESETLYTADNWISQSGGDQRDSTNRTSDAYKGDYALELVSFIGEKDGDPVARPEQISTGYYPDNCDGNCTELGGYPFANQMDTLAFWYKFFPAADDYAEVSMHFKKNGISMDWRSDTLAASSEYQYFEIPFMLWQTPDTVILHLQSAQWNDTLLYSAGSKLIIDEVHFKSQPILYAGLPSFVYKDKFSVYPNPSAGRFKIRNDAGISQVIVYNMIGKPVFSKINSTRERLNEVDLSRFQKGIYYIEIYNGTRIHTEKIVIQ